MCNAQDMVDDCLNVINIPKDRGGPGFNQWERDFIESLDERLREGRNLTERQIDKLESIWNRI